MKVVLVTGAARGLGAAIVGQLSEAGVTAIGATRADCDVADYDQVSRFVARVLGQHGRIDAVINNAGVIEPIAMLADGDPAVWAHAISVNLVGGYNVIHAVLPAMLAAGHGCIVNISSGAAARPHLGWSAYCAGKAGLALLTRSVHLEYGGRGIRTFGLRPGLMDTGMQNTIHASGIENEVTAHRRDQLPSTHAPSRIAAWLAIDAPEDLCGRELAAGDEGLSGRADAGIKACRDQSNFKLA